MDFRKKNPFVEDLECPRCDHEFEAEVCWDTTPGECPKCGNGWSLEEQYDEHSGDCYTYLEWEHYMSDLVKGLVDGNHNLTEEEVKDLLDEEGTSKQAVDIFNRMEPVVIDPRPQNDTRSVPEWQTVAGMRDAFERVLMMYPTDPRRVLVAQALAASIEGPVRGYMGKADGKSGER